MKYVCTLLLCLALVLPISMALNAQPQAAPPAARTDIYHVHFNKAAIGQAAALAEQLKTQGPNAPMPGHFIVLRHQEGDDWDYCVIEHLGTKATVQPTPGPANPAAGGLSAWHNDTFVSGPSWAEFSKAMGIAAGDKTGGSVYTVAVWRAAPGHRDQLEKALSQPPDPASKVSVSQVMLQHLEGGPWQFLAINRYNSWQDFAADQTANAPATGSGTDTWSEVRAHSSYHHDTLADRIAPK